MALIREGRHNGTITSVAVNEGRSDKEVMIDLLIHTDEGIDYAWGILLSQSDDYLDSRLAELKQIGWDAATGFGTIQELAGKPIAFGIEHMTTKDGSRQFAKAFVSKAKPKVALAGAKQTAMERFLKGKAGGGLAATKAAAPAAKRAPAPAKAEEPNWDEE